MSLNFRREFMRSDIKDVIDFLGKEASAMFNKAELARRYNCDPRTIDRYIKLANGTLEKKPSKRQYSSKLDPYKEVIIDKVEVHLIFITSVISKKITVEKSR